MCEVEINVLHFASLIVWLTLICVYAVNSAISKQSGIYFVYIINVICSC